MRNLYNLLQLDNTIPVAFTKRLCKRVCLVGVKQLQRMKENQKQIPVSEMIFTEGEKKVLDIFLTKMIKRWQCKC